LIIMIVLFSASFLFAGEQEASPKKEVVTPKVEQKSVIAKKYESIAEEQFYRHQIEVKEEKHQGKIRTIKAHYNYRIRIKYSGHNRRYCRRSSRYRRYSSNSYRMYSLRACP